MGRSSRCAGIHGCSRTCSTLVFLPLLISQPGARQSCLELLPFLAFLVLLGFLALAMHRLHIDTVIRRVLFPSAHVRVF